MIYVKGFLTDVQISSFHFVHVPFSIQFHLFLKASSDICGEWSHGSVSPVHTSQDHLKGFKLSLKLYTDV